MYAEKPAKRNVSQLLSALLFVATFGIAVLVLVSIPAPIYAQSDTSPDCMGNFCKTMPYKGSQYLTGACKPPQKGESPSKDGLVGKPCAVKGQKITVTGKCLPIQPKCKSVGDTGEKMMMMGMPPMLPMPMMMPKMMMMPMPMMPNTDPCKQADGTTPGIGNASSTQNCPTDSLWRGLLNSTFGGSSTGSTTLEKIANTAKRLIIGPIQAVSQGTGEKKNPPPVIKIVGGETGALGPDGKSKEGTQGAATSQDLTYTKFNTGPTGFGGPTNTVPPPQNTSVLGTMLTSLSDALKGLLGLFQ